MRPRTDGRIDEKRLREIFVGYLPKPDADKWLWIGIDASSIARPEAVTSPDRRAQHVHNLPECHKPITFGWQFSTVVMLPETPSSWTYILDQLRVVSETTAIQVACVQLILTCILTCPIDMREVGKRSYDTSVRG